MSDEIKTPTILIYQTEREFPSLTEARAHFYKQTKVGDTGIFKTEHASYSIRKGYYNPYWLTGNIV